MSERILDWKLEHDDRSRNYAIRDLIDESNLNVKEKMWKEGIVLDQGSEGACVGFGWTGELLAEPFAPTNQPVTAAAEHQALSYYKRAQKIDQWEGEDYSGTSVLAGAKIIMEEGFIKGYRWCFGVDDLRDAVIQEGPVVIGVRWYKGMYSTLPNGLVKIDGDPVGGHCLVVTGYSSSMKIEGEGSPLEVFRWRNSWGPDYGLGGSAFIKFDDMKNLLSQGAEACIPVDRQPVDGVLSF